MKWSKSRKHYSDYCAWQDLFNVMAVTLVLAIIATFVVVLLLTFMNPRLVTAGDITNFRTARRMAAEPVKILYMEITAYSPTVAQTDASPLITASGKRVYVGGIAADLSVFPFGTKLQIPGYNNGDPCTVIDTGSAIKDNKLDVFMYSAHEATHWGRRKNVPVRVLFVPEVTP
jgi:3D (Asp-Asp-Asp) domain-containing protein